MKGLLLALLIFAAHYQPAIGYTQTTTSCQDPRTQFPSYPPCQK
jgi:hypothetical protein